MFTVDDYTDFLNVMSPVGKEIEDEIDKAIPQAVMKHDCSQGINIYVDGTYSHHIMRLIAAKYIKEGNWYAFAYKAGSHYNEYFTYIVLYTERAFKAAGETRHCDFTTITKEMIEREDRYANLS